MYRATFLCHVSLFLVAFTISQTLAEEQNRPQDTQSSPIFEFEQTADTDQLTTEFDDDNEQLSRLRRQLRQKQKRLRELRKEVDQLKFRIKTIRAEDKKSSKHTQQLESNTGDESQQNDATTAAATRDVNTPVVPKTIRHKPAGKWRKKFKRRLNKLFRRVEELETEIEQNTSDSNKQDEQMTKRERKRQRRKKNKQRRRLLQHAQQLLEARKDNTMQPMTLQQAATQALKGFQGSTCEAHRNCKPGVCCHNNVPIADNTLNVCVSHDLPVGALCVDSCQCSAGLHCFQKVGDSIQPYRCFSTNSSQQPSRRQAPTTTTMTVAVKTPALTMYYMENIWTIRTKCSILI